MHIGYESIYKYLDPNMLLYKEKIFCSTNRVEMKEHQ